MKKTKSVKRKSKIGESTVSKKVFRDNPVVEELYKNIYEYKLREEAYKTALEMYIHVLGKEKQT